MDNNPTAPPPSYGAVVGEQPSSNQPYPPADPNQPPYPPAGQAFPQPGQVPAAAGYSEPPPKYEPPKDAGQHQPYPPAGGYAPYPQQGPYTQQPQGYQGATVYPGQTTVHQTVVISQPGYGPQPKNMECPNCHAMVTTSVNYQSGGLTWLSAGLLCLFGCWMGCCLIPFCIEDLQDVEHRCPNCHKHLGSFTRFCWFGCCCIPFCANDCKDAVHSCPNCKKYIARYNRL